MKGRDELRREEGREDKREERKIEQKGKERNKEWGERREVGRGILNLEAIQIYGIRKSRGIILISYTIYMHYLCT